MRVVVSKQLGPIIKTTSYTSSKQNCFIDSYISSLRVVVSKQPGPITKTTSYTASKSPTNGLVCWNTQWVGSHRQRKLAIDYSSPQIGFPPHQFLITIPSCEIHQRIGCTNRALRLSLTKIDDRRRYSQPCFHPPWNHSPSWAGINPPIMTKAGPTHRL